jgi:hypothetical protein
MFAVATNIDADTFLLAAACNEAICRYIVWQLHYADHTMTRRSPHLKADRVLYQMWRLQNFSENYGRY